MESRQPLKVIFLDLDGVLNWEETEDRINGFLGLCSERIDRLNQITDTHRDAKIVISSTWRKTGFHGCPDFKALKALLRRRGIEAKIIGHTPIHFGYRPRGDEIREWISDWREENPGEELRYVILDDDTENMAPFTRPRLPWDTDESHQPLDPDDIRGEDLRLKHVVTTFHGGPEGEGGLQDRHVTLAIGILNGDSICLDCGELFGEYHQIPCGGLGEPGMNCLPQDFLRNGGTLEQLQDLYHIQVKRGQEFPNLVLLKYNQIESPMGEPLVRACRGLILDEADDWEIVSRPFDKFFNHGEKYAAEIDWARARVQEKLDGSLMQLYRYRMEWRVGTSGTPDASGEVNGCGITFRDLFWKVWEEKGYELPSSHDHGVTFMFELMTPLNRVVVRHGENGLKLIGVRNDNGFESPVSLFYGYDWEIVKEFQLRDIKGIEATFGEMNPLEQEGYVVVDNEHRRVKVKHPGYVAIHHMRDGFGPRRVLEAIRSGETSELLTHFPEWTEAFNRVQTAYDKFMTELEVAYTEACLKTGVAFPPGTESNMALVQKEFARHATEFRYSSPLFMLRAGKIEAMRQHLRDMNIRTLMDLLGVKDMEF